MKTIVINLIDRNDRLDQFISEWSWLDFDVCEGIRDKILHKGCGLAHIKAIREGLKNNEWCLILEDDAILNCSRDKFLSIIEDVTKQVTWDAVFLGAISDNKFSAPKKIVHVHSLFFQACETKSLRSCSAMLWSRNCLKVIDEYEKILNQNYIFAIDRMLTSHYYPWIFENNEWDECEVAIKIDIIPNVWICKDCLVTQRVGILSDNTNEVSINYEDNIKYTNYLYNKGLT